MNKKRLILEILIGSIFTIFIFIYFYLKEFYPTGNDIYGHLYKAEFLANEIKNGNWYPLYSTDWYNGLQLFRYWPIFTYYILSIFYFIVNDIFVVYYMFLSFTFLLGYIGWCLIANRENKISFIIIGILYWFLPDNIRVIFGEGNLARVFIFAILPIFFYYFTNLIERKKSFYITVILVSIITITHFMLAAMCAIIFTIYSFFYGLKKKTWHLGFTSFICGFLISGLILFPGISGGLMSDGSTASIETMKDWSQSLLISISIFNRMNTICTFGISVLLICILNLLFNKRRIGTIIGVIFFMLTSTIFIPFLIQLPLSQVWWMARFIQMCYILIFYEFGFLHFNKKYVKIILFLFIVLDIIPSFQYYKKVDNEFNKEYLLDEAIELVDSRLGVIDESSMGPYISYYAYKKKVPYLQGWAIQGASTKNNLVETTESFKMGFYGYSFKNLLELGCDSVLVKKQILSNFNEQEFLKQANHYGYKLKNETTYVYLFDNENVKDTYGTEFIYDNLCIGSSSLYLSYLYPSFERGYSNNIEDYSYEELLNYKKIFLSNFSYSNKNNLEKLLLQLSEDGVDIYIDTTHLPINYLSISEILGIESRFINIYELNSLHYKGKEFKISNSYEWYTTYLVSNNDKAIMSYYSYGNQELGYIAELDNINFIGFNLLYLYIENQSYDLRYLLDEIFQIQDRNSFINYHIYPIDVKYEKNKIKIESDYGCISNIAYQDNFKSSSNILKDNNLIYVEEGETIIIIYYKYFWIGLFISIMGIICTLIVYSKIVNKGD